MVGMKVLSRMARYACDAQRTLKTRATVTLAASLFLAAASFTACDNPLGDALADEVAYHGATTRNLSVIAPAGVKISSTGTLRVKEGFPVTLTATMETGYVFGEWAQTGGSGTVTFSAPDKNTTDVTVKGGNAEITATALTAFAVVSRSPENDGVNIASTVRVVFNREPSLPSPGPGITLARTDTAANVAGTVTVDGTALVFTPGAPLETDVTYTATLAATVADTLGYALAVPLSWNFTTGDSDAPFNPQITVNSGDAWTNETTVQLSLSVEDNSAPHQMRVSNSAVYANSDWQTFATTLQWTLDSGDGTKSVYVWFKDQEGNLSLSATDAIGLDTIVPSGTAAFTAAYTNGDSGTISLSATDSASGVSRMRVSTSATYADSGWENYTTSKAWALISADGPQTAYVWYRDAAGNVSAPYAATITRDTTAPSVISTVVGSGAANPSPATTSYIDIKLPPDTDTSALLAFTSPGATPTATFKLYQTSTPSYYYFPATALTVSTEAGTGNKIVRYSFARILSFNTQYTIEIRGAASGSGALRDLAGNELATKQTVNFTTKERTLTLSNKLGEIQALSEYGQYFYFRDMILSADGTRLYGITNPRSGYSYGKIFGVNLQSASELQQSDMDLVADIPMATYRPWGIAQKGSWLYVSAENDYTYAFRTSDLTEIHATLALAGGQLPVPAYSGLAVVSSEEILGIWYPADVATSLSSGNLLDSSSSGYYSSAFASGYDLGTAIAYGDTLIYGSTFTDMEDVPYLDVINLDFYAGGPGGASFVQQYGFTKNDNTPLLGKPTAIAIDSDTAQLYVALTGTGGYGLTIFNGIEDVSYSDSLYRSQTLTSVADVSAMSLASATASQKTLFNYESLLGFSHGGAGNTGGTAGTKGFSIVGVNALETAPRSVLSYAGAMESNGRYAYKILVRNIDGFTYDIFLMRGTSENTMDRIEAYRLTVN